MNEQSAEDIRITLRIRGQVQGVGFRPFVWRMAHESGVTGRVLNDVKGVYVEAQGECGVVEGFVKRVFAELPPLARVDGWEREEVAVVAGEAEFKIDESVGGQGGGMAGERVAAVAVDSAVCGDCLREMGKPGDRREGHGLINCTNCGPRFSIIRDIPYDRPNTTMAAFAMCAACRAEYENPGDRRFHAQPICCPKCGPRVELVTLAEGKRGKQRVKVKGNPFAGAARLLVEGKVVAIKGIGGFHLAVRADREGAVARLRKLKKRDAKPFALMCRDLAGAQELVELSVAGARELSGVGAPIVVAPRKAGARVAEGVAAGTYTLGVMLPYTPMQHLLWEALAKCCAEAGEAALGALVMTSGNESSEPLAIDNGEAVERLGGLCDAFLWHDRAIERCVDDSVILDRGEGKAVLPVRRSRGYVPTGWLLRDGAKIGPTGICLGGELKNTIAVVRERDIVLSQHLGDLTNVLAYEHFQKAVEDLIRLFEVRVDFVGHDLHPDYMSTVAARKLAEKTGAKLIGIQHHHAHAVGLLAEHAVREPALVVVCDGTGYGTDGTIWGGELLWVHGTEWKRVGRLKPMRLPGGDAAAVDPRRSALSLLERVYGEGFETLPMTKELFPEEEERRVLGKMIRKGVNSPWTSSTGRLFDGVAALLGVCRTNAHEAEAAMALEAAGARWTGKSQEALDLCAVRREGSEGIWELDMGGVVKWLVDQMGEGAEVGWLAREFHRQLAEGWVTLAEAAGGGVKLLGASGGVFCNQLLERELGRVAPLKGYCTFFHNLYPPTDAGLAFGQAIFCKNKALTGEAGSDKKTNRS